MTVASRRTLLVVGGGWAGLAAAVSACDAGWEVTVIEAARHWGGRARRLCVTDRNATPWTLDNGQHILIGAYTATLRLLQRLGVDLGGTLQRLPLALPYPDGDGLALPRWAQRLPARLMPLALAAGLLTVPGWRVRDRLAALRVAARWQRAGFACAPQATVADLCAGLPARVVADWIEPLCVAALNTPVTTASGAVFLRVLRDALRGAAMPPYAPSDLLVPRVDLGRLLPDAAVAMLQRSGARLLTGARAVALERAAGDGWRVGLADGQTLGADAVVLATPAQVSARLLQTLPPAADDEHVRAWIECARGLEPMAIATVYLVPPSTWRWSGPGPLLALRAHPVWAPAEFVFRRETDAGTCLAFVVSAPDPALAADRQALTAAVRAQAAKQLRLQGAQVLQTVLEKRATFACTPALRRPPQAIAPGLVAAGDAIDGPYPATLEGAVRSGVAAVAALEPLSGAPLL
ncbi:HpnE: squalene-associated FAD-dependent desaturase [Tepidimonas thermarum]|uniref:HpnE: squalene-associated FAD-dependent desaturase n=1 Tax=Tepidimonas thermarum TaxID=335431 RepID=A0A554WZQ9_9BURK|nr:HpnE: squalene-associated FAD-dependent desaturase [Tepidimonas thermarum]